MSEEARGHLARDQQVVSILLRPRPAVEFKSITGGDPGLTPFFRVLIELMVIQALSPESALNAKNSSPGIKRIA
jgi:hypothetical protein